MSSPHSPPSAYEVLARQAYALALLLRDRGRSGAAAWRKAHDALRFSATASTPSLAVPSKLVGVRSAQGALAALAAQRPPFGLRLELVVEGDLAKGDLLDVKARETSDTEGTASVPAARVPACVAAERRIVVRVAATAEAGTLGGLPLGYVQAKHVPWLVDLLPLGVEVRLTHISGGGTRGYFGCNVHFIGVGAALGRLARYGTSWRCPPEDPTAGDFRPGESPPVDPPPGGPAPRRPTSPTTSAGRRMPPLAEDASSPGDDGYTRAVAGSAGLPPGHAA